MRKKISIIITCYNYGKYLEEALGSVFNSDYDNFEVILVDDGSTDSYTIEKIEEIENKGLENLIIIRQENSGVSVARNNGFKASSGDYVVFLDADDKIDRDYLKKCAEKLDRNSKVSFVYTNSIFFSEKNNVKIFNLKYNFYSLLFRNYIPITSMIRREAFAFVSGYKKCNYEDWELYINLSKNNFEGFYLNEYLFFYRVHANSKQVRDDKNKQENILQIRNIHKDLYNDENLKLMKKEAYSNVFDFVFSEIYRVIRAFIVRARIKSL